MDDAEAAILARSNLLVVAPFGMDLDVHSNRSSVVAPVSSTINKMLNHPEEMERERERLERAVQSEINSFVHLFPFITERNTQPGRVIHINAVDCSSEDGSFPTNNVAEGA